MSEIKLPPNLTNVREGAFHGCTSLSEITLPPVLGLFPSDPTLSRATPGRHDHVLQRGCPLCHRTCTETPPFCARTCPAVRRWNASGVPVCRKFCATHPPMMHETSPRTISSPLAAHGRGRRNTPPLSLLSRELSKIPRSHSPSEQTRKHVASHVSGGVIGSSGGQLLNYMLYACPAAMRAFGVQCVDFVRTAAYG